MKSPITGNEMELKTESGFEVKFRNENFVLIHKYWLCTDSGERFTDDSLDDLFLSALSNQYRKKHGLGEEVKIFADEY